MQIPGSIAGKVLESEARLDIELAAIASNVIPRVFFGGEGSRPPPGFGKRIAPQDHGSKRKAAWLAAPRTRRGAPGAISGHAAP